MEADNKKVEPNDLLSLKKSHDRTKKDIKRNLLNAAQIGLGILGGAYIGYKTASGSYERALEYEKAKSESYKKSFLDSMTLMEEKSKTYEQRLEHMAITNILNSKKNN